MNKLYIEETNKHRGEPIIEKHKKQILINRICWTAGSALCLILTIILAIVSTAVCHWETKFVVISTVIPGIATILASFMTVLIYIANEVGVKMYKNDKITFYSGPWNNALYVNDVVVYKGSAEHKLWGVLSDKSIAKVNLQFTQFTITILPPGTDPITGKKVQQPSENKVEVPVK